MDGPEIIILSEVSQTEKNKHHRISHVESKNDTSELIYKTDYKTERDSQT